MYFIIWQPPDKKNSPSGINGLPYYNNRQKKKRLFMFKFLKDKCHVNTVIYIKFNK